MGQQPLKDIHWLEVGSIAKEGIFLDRPPAFANPRLSQVAGIAACMNRKAAASPITEFITIALFVVVINHY